MVARRRLLAALAVGAAAAVFLGLVVPNLPCSVPGGDECAPADEAIELVPATSLLYAHANLEGDSDQFEMANDIAVRTPLVSEQVIGQLLSLSIGSAGQPSDFGEDVRPWFGGELAVAAVAAEGAAAQQVQLIEVDDADGAREYADSIAAGSPEAEDYREIEVSVDERGLASALVDDFLVLGSAPGVRAIIDVATEASDTQSLAADATATEAIDALPEQRFAEAYFSRDGITAYFSSPDSVLSSFEPLLDSRVARGAAIALSADDGGFSVASRSILDPERAQAKPGFFTAFEAFEPSLTESLDPESLAYLGLGDSEGTIAGLLEQASSRAPGIASGLAQLVKDLRKAAGVDLERDLAGAIRGEAALAVVPRADEEDSDAPEEGLPGQVAPATLPPETATPYLEFLADDVDEDRARDALARLQEPIAAQFDPAQGAPVFDTEQIGGVEAQVLRLPPTAAFAYAIFDGMLAVANDTAGLRRAIEGGDDSLAESDRFQAATSPLPDQPALLAYLDVAGLLSFAEASGLATDTNYTAFAPDLRRIRSFALAIGQGEESRLDVDARALIDEPTEHDGEATGED